MGQARYLEDLEPDVLPEVNRILFLSKLQDLERVVIKQRRDFNPIYFESFGMNLSERVTDSCIVSVIYLATDCHEEVQAVFKHRKRR